MKVLKLDYGVDVDIDCIQSIFEKAMSNGSNVKPEDLVEAKQWKKKQS